MRGFLVVVRCLLLLLLVGWMLYGLVAALIRDRRNEYPPPGPGRDPGLRVLLAADGDDDGEGPGRPQVNLVVQQTALLYCPDAPDDYRLELDFYARLQLQPDPQSGLTISGSSLPSSLVWPVTRVRLIPLTLPPDRQDAAYHERPDFEAENERAVFAIGKRRYRGCLDVERTGAKTLVAINTLPVEAYLEGVLQSELSAAWPLAALKAQAVVGRSIAYAARSRPARRFEKVPYHLADGEDDQAYRGTGRGGKAIDLALAETRGQVLTYRGLAFAPLFHPSSGGHTAAVVETFPDAATADGSLSLADVMPAQPDPYCRPGAEALGAEDRYWRSRLVLTSKQLRRKLLRVVEDSGWIQKIVPVGEEVADGVRRVRKVRLPIYRSTYVMSGPEFRILLGPAVLRSTLWSADSPRRLGDTEVLTWEIVTYGWGHGVGMSQVSAWYMAAERDFDYRQILDFFYLDTELSPPKW